MEQEEYTKERIEWSYIEFIDNQDVLDLIEKVQVLLRLSFIILCIPKFIAIDGLNVLKKNLGK